MRRRPPPTIGNKQEYAEEAFTRIRHALEIADSLQRIDEIHRVNEADLVIIREASPAKSFFDLMRLAAERRKELSGVKQ